MANHENRSTKKSVAGRTPRAEDITQARERAGLTQQQAAEEIYTAIGTYRNWEQNIRPMPPAAFEFSLLKAGHYRVEDLLKPGEDADGALPMITLRTDDGRLIGLRIRPEELARLSRLLRPHLSEKA